MKKLLYFTIVLLSLTACEKKYVNDFAIVNNCPDEISVYYNVSGKLMTKIDKIPANSEKIFYTANWSKSSNKGVEKEFWDMSIFRNGTETAKNLLNNDNWQMINIDETHTKWILTINSSDF